MSLSRTLLLLLCGASSLEAQRTVAAPERAIRRTVPITNSIRRAMLAGTRDSTGRPGRAYWQLRTDYTIRVRLDPASAALLGRERISLHNASPDSLRQMVVRLPANHFRGENPRAASWVPAENTQGMMVSRLAVDGVEARINAGPPTRGTTPQLPTLSGATSTTALLQLPKPIAPGARVELDLEWHHQLPGGPGVGHRMTQRWADSLFQPTQWFPRLSVYDDLRGWDSELYLGPSEFYNDFGRYDVSIDVPAGWIVSGTGVLQNPGEVLTAPARDRLSRVLQSDSTITIVGADEIGPGRATAPGERLTWRFVADSVNDFAWATARKFVWTATRATIPGKGPVPIHMVFLPGRERLFTPAGPVTRHALEFYSKLWFPYAFPQLTLQDGPSSGMEYPMVINSNVGAADHETGHQWWPMVVSNNETWYGWMDEGFNQYMNVLSAADSRGQPAALERMGQTYGRISGDEAEPPMMWNANYAGPAYYGFTTYSKTPLMLAMLGGIVGDSAVQRAQREWAMDWRFKHPSPWDWMFSMQRSLGVDLGWFWYYWLFTTERVDGRIQDVRQAGVGTSVTVHQAGEMPSPVVLDVEFAEDGPPIRSMKNAVMRSERTARVTYPVDVWFGGSRTFVAQLMFGGRKVVKVTLDPDGRFPDRDPADNVWPR